MHIYTVRAWLYPENAQDPFARAFKVERDCVDMKKVHQAIDDFDAAGSYAYEIVNNYKVRQPFEDEFQITRVWTEED